MAVWSHKEWQQLEIQIHSAPEDVTLHMAAVRRLVAEEKYRALVEEQEAASKQKQRSAFKLFWWR